MNQGLVGSEGPERQSLQHIQVLDPTVGVRVVHMAGSDFFIRPATGTSSTDWLRIPDSDISVTVTRRITRTVTHGGEGDDLIDEGAESAVYTIEGEMDLDMYKQVMEMFRGGQPYIHDPFSERDVKVVFSKMHFEGSTGRFIFELIEDIR